MVKTHAMHTSNGRDTVSHERRCELKILHTMASRALTPVGHILLLHLCILYFFQHARAVVGNASNVYSRAAYRTQGSRARPTYRLLQLCSHA